MNKEIIGYKCKKCGKLKYVHKATTFECPAPGRGNFKGFSTEQYEEDKSKPVMGYNL
jgi:uncharacterized OB-fold protein